LKSLPSNKTKIVCTIGPASESQDVMERMILAGMNVARLNFSHGDFDGHKQVIEKLRAVGHKIRVLNKPGSLGNAHGLTIEYGKNGKPLKFYGAADPRGMGLAKSLN